MSEQPMPGCQRILVGPGDDVVSSAPDLYGLINMPFAEWFTGACADDTEDTPITLWDGLRTTTHVP